MYYNVSYWATDSSFSYNFVGNTYEGFIGRTNGTVYSNGEADFTDYGVFVNASSEEEALALLKANYE